MHNLITFLVRHIAWFLFIILEAISLLLLVKHNDYQRSVITSWVNECVASVQQVSGEVVSFVQLRNTNRLLMEQNGELTQQVLRLKQQLKIEQNDNSTASVLVLDSLLPYPHLEFVTAQVVNNSITRANNYITIDKGSSQGVRPDMGVLSSHGLVGVVASVSENYSIVLPILHSGFRQSVKISRTNSFGTLMWDGRDAQYAQVDELPRYQQVEKGDTIVTSGFSSIFPEGVLVGVVEDFNKPTDDNFYNLKVRLFTNFHNLSFVQVIRNVGQDERNALEREGIYR